MSNQVTRIIQIIRLDLLLAAALVYSLGAGVAHYLGADINWNIYWVGQAWISLVQISKSFLSAYFEPLENPAKPKPDNQLPRLALLAVSGACLTVAASLTLALFQSSRFNPVIIIILLIGFLEAFFYSTPPFRLSSQGYGELTSAITGSVLTSSLSLLLQFGTLHRLLAMTTFSLAALHMAMLVVMDLPQYAADLKFRPRRLLVQMGWERALTFHNLLILAAFGLLGIAILFGLPFAIGGPAMLALPIGGLQIWLINNLAAGARPNWRLLVFSSAALYLVFAYLLAFAFWTH